MTDEQKAVLGNKYQIFDTTLTPEQRAEIERKATRREMAKLERENENLKAAPDAALKQTKLSKDFRHDESETARIANRLIKQLSVVDLTESEKSEFIEKLPPFPVRKDGSFFAQWLCPCCTIFY